MRRMEERDVSLLCAAINDDSRVRKLVVKAITSTIFERLPDVMRAAREGEAVEACGAEEAFLPREELYGREGTGTSLPYRRPFGALTCTGERVTVPSLLYSQE